MRISDWSSDVCSSDLEALRTVLRRDGPDALPDALAAAAHDNPLLQAWGAAGREFDAQLFAYDLVQPSTETELYREPPRDTLLHALQRSEEHTSELQSLMRISYAVFCLKKKKHHTIRHTHRPHTQSQSDISAE